MFKREFSETELTTLRLFVTLGISVDQFLSQMADYVQVRKLTPSDRVVDCGPVMKTTITISRDDIRWVIRRYLAGKTSGEELSNWAGLLLAIPVYSFSEDIKTDAVLELLADLAAPLKSEYLDREVLRDRIAAL